MWKQRWMVSDCNAPFVTPDNDLLITEPGKAAVEAERLQERRLADLQRRLWIAVSLSAPLVVIAMFLMHEPWANWAMWSLSTPSGSALGWPFFKHAWRQARHLRANMDTLVAVSTGVAYEVLN